MLVRGDLKPVSRWSRTGTAGVADRVSLDQAQRHCRCRESLELQHAQAAQHKIRTHCSLNPLALP